MNDTELLAKRTKNLQELLGSQQTLLLATASINGVPDMSYAPFVRDETGCFYILISELAAHTPNLYANPQASVMFISPEHKSHNLFARERAIFDCTAKEIKRDDEAYTVQCNALLDQFGDIVRVLSSLRDFHLFALTPVSGRYVAGFGQAYTINTKDGSLSPLVKRHG